MNPTSRIQYDWAVRRAGIQTTFSTPHAAYQAWRAWLGSVMLRRVNGRWERAI